MVLVLKWLERKQQLTKIVFVTAGAPPEQKTTENLEIIEKSFDVVSTTTVPSLSLRNQYLMSGRTCKLRYEL